MAATTTRSNVLQFDRPSPRTRLPLATTWNGTATPSSVHSRASRAHRFFYHPDLEKQLEYLEGVVRHRKPLGRHLGDVSTFDESGGIAGLRCRHLDVVDVDELLARGLDGLDVRRWSVGMR